MSIRFLRICSILLVAAVQTPPASGTTISGSWIGVIVDAASPTRRS